MQDIVQWNYGSWPDGLPKKGGANALSGAGSLDTATTCPSKTSRTKNFIIEFQIPVDSFNATPGGGRVVIATSNRDDSSPSTTNQRQHDEVYETPRFRCTDPYPYCHAGVAVS